jgi:hypothetical protein
MFRAKKNQIQIKTIEAFATPFHEHNPCGEVPIIVYAIDNSSLVAILIEVLIV